MAVTVRRIGRARATARMTMANPGHGFRRPILHERRQAMAWLRPESGNHPPGRANRAPCHTGRRNTRRGGIRGNQPPDIRAGIWVYRGFQLDAWQGDIDEAGPRPDTVLVHGTADRNCRGFTALLFRKGIDWLQATLFLADSVSLLRCHAAQLPWYWNVLVPVVGGLLVGQIMQAFSEDGRVQAVADVIKGAALRDGRMPLKLGLAFVAVSFITLGSGGSSGREGPVVHMAALISS